MASVGLGAFAQGLAGGMVQRKQDGDRKEANARADRVLDLQLEIAKTNADAMRSMAAAQGGGYGGGLGIRPGGGPVAAGFGSVPDDERELLARTIQAEAGGEGYDGMLAVGAVIGNRARSGKYGGTSFRDVIMAPGQFSAWNGVTGYAKGEGALNMDRITPSEHALRVADAILAGKYDDPTGGATHYYNPAAAKPKWGKDAGGNWQQIGNHIFGFADGRPGAGTRRAAPAAAQAQASATAPKPDTAVKRATLRLEYPGYKGVPDNQLDAAIQHFEKTRGAVPARGMGVS
ncbi:cell wall hydrolase [Paracoccus sp. 22332]|uniref:cell wall hydrolase n=1 Tax=Paracoccus sp. 22332 TaxID=3453913 RepID=UPI003F873004